MVESVCEVISLIQYMKFWSLILLLVCDASGAEQSVRLEIRIQHRASGQPFVFDKLVHATPPGTPYRITRLAYLLARPQLQRDDGSWVSFDAAYALIEAHCGDGKMVLAEVPAGEYRAIAWTLGVPADVNHSDPAQWPAGHALNPSQNNLHWSWQEGYIFMALQGRYRNRKGKQPGFVYHVANRPQLRTVNLQGRIHLREDTTLLIDFDVPALFKGLDMQRDTASTHSRSADDVARGLADRAAAAFRLIGSSNGAINVADSTPQPVYPPGTTPVRFRLPRGVSVPNLALDNPLTREGIALGHTLFFDARLSQGNRLSCASCHRPAAAFSDPGRRFSPGVAGKTGDRNTMALFNLAWHPNFFWDGRAPSLRQQVLQPIQNELEMNQSLPEVLEKLRGEPYAGRFHQAFGSEGVSIERMALALEQYLLSLQSFDSKFDRAARGEVRLSEQETRGMQLFHMEFDPRRGFRGADCFHCHGGMLFSNHRLFNIGLDASDSSKFKAPSLRNVAITTPYMHDGRFTTLEEVIEHYDHGVQRTDTLDANLAKHPEQGMQLSHADKAALVAFLKALTDPQFVAQE